MEGVKIWGRWDLVDLVKRGDLQNLVIQREWGFEIVYIVYIMI